MSPKTVALRDVCLLFPVVLLGFVVFYGQAAILLHIGTPHHFTLMPVLVVLCLSWGRRCLLFSYQARWLCAPFSCPVLGRHLLSIGDAGVLAGREGVRGGDCGRRREEDVRARPPPEGSPIPSWPGTPSREALQAGVRPPCVFFHLHFFCIFRDCCISLVFWRCLFIVFLFISDFLGE